MFSYIIVSFSAAGQELFSCEIQYQQEPVFYKGIPFTGSCRCGVVRYTYKEGLKDGFYQKFYDNGSLAETGYFEKGVQKGCFTKYTPNGGIESTIIYGDNGRILSSH